MPLIYTRPVGSSPSVSSVTSSDNVLHQKMTRALMSAMVVAVAVVAMVAASPSPAQSPRSYTECSNSADCGQGRCCVIVNGRYATTACMPRLQTGQQCRPGNALSQTLHFPGGASVHVTDVYHSLCPCEGAPCSPSGTCTR